MRRGRSGDEALVPAEGEREIPVGARTAAMVLGVLGSVWWLTALLGGAVRSPTIWLLVGIGIGGFLVWNASRLAVDDRVDEFQVHRQAWVRSVLVQLVIGAVVVVVCLVLDRRELVGPLVALLVGLHLHPYAEPFRWRGYRWLAIALVVVGVLGLVLALTGAGPGSIALVTSGLAGICLWIASSGLVAASPDPA